MAYELTERTRENLAWAAGIFEGEGCISVHARHNGIVRVAMTDADVVERFRDVLGYGRLYVPREDPRQEHYKDIITWAAGSFEHVQATVAMLWPWLGERRRARALEVLAEARKSAIRTAQRTHCPKGHPYSGRNLRVSMGRRMCRTCRGEAGFREVAA